MFIKTVFALYFTTIAIAAPVGPLSSVGSDAGKLIGGTSSPTRIHPH
jgi:hypothetical protein